MHKTVSILLLLFSQMANARLGSSTLDELIARSEVILEASPVVLERLTDRPFGGRATFRVYRVWAGAFEGERVQVTWSSEVHDQPIENLGRDYLLFLRKGESGDYTGALYGRSYWVFEGGRITDVSRADLDSDQRHISYKHPASGVILTEAQKKALMLKAGKAGQAGKDSQSSQIMVKPLRLYIAAKKKP